MLVHVHAVASIRASRSWRAHAWFLARKYCGTSVEMMERHYGRYMDSDDGQLGLLVGDAPERAREAAGGEPAGGGDGPPRGRRRDISRARAGTFAGTFRGTRVNSRATRAEGGRFEPGSPRTYDRSHSVWVTAAISMAVGVGMTVISLATTALVFVFLSFGPRLGSTKAERGEEEERTARNDRGEHWNFSRDSLWPMHSCQARRL
jgi:hypothetical protein